MVVNHCHVVEHLRHLGVELQGLFVLLQSPVVLAVAGVDQRHVVEDERPVIGVFLEPQRLLVVLQGFGVFTIALGAHAIAVVGKGFLGFLVGGQHLEDQVRHHREALIDEVVVALTARQGALAKRP